MSQSWFYLTLWRGTPPEFTDEFDADLSQTEYAEAAVHEVDAVRADIDTQVAKDVNIIEKDTATVSITTTLEVIWFVG